MSLASLILYFRTSASFLLLLYALSLRSRFLEYAGKTWTDAQRRLTLRSLSSRLLWPSSEQPVLKHVTAILVLCRSRRVRSETKDLRLRVPNPQPCERRVEPDPNSNSFRILRFKESRCMPHHFPLRIVMTPLLKIPLLFSDAIGMRITGKPPNSPLPPEEHIVPDWRERFLKSLAWPCVFLRGISWSLEIIETVVILLASTNHPFPEYVLSRLEFRPMPPVL
ncbi:hypothetical protein BDZ89DRAFT_1231867 [Hymenopellis radicata]|nr:hypothetical protein BDZ89DRAFT_1231867 [Hymenopellis radicata]